MSKQILDFLKRSKDYLSGEELSKTLGVTRSAIWKQIQELKNLGYDIVAVPHLGYQLVGTPDRLYAHEVSQGLKTKFIGKQISYFDALASTMDVAAQLGMGKAAEGSIVLAESQTKGRGRLRRDWLSPKYKGIYFSLILRPKILPAEASLLTLLAAVSICQAIKKVSDLEAKIKWPNDIFINGKKLGGILTELNAQMDEVNFVVIGIGLNINNDKKSLIASATSLKELKKESVSRIELLQEILRKIEENYLVFQKKKGIEVIKKWREYSFTLGKRVKVVEHAKRLEGVAIDIENDGGLLLKDDAGLVHKVMAGDIVQ